LLFRAKAVRIERYINFDMTPKKSRIISPEELGDLLRDQSDIYGYLQAGLLPIKLIRDRIGVVIGRDAYGNLTIES